MFSLIDSWRNRRRDTLQKQTSNLTPYVRNQISQDIITATTTNQHELEELERSLETSRERLQKAESSERFVGMRVARYREALDQKSRRLRVKQEEETKQPINHEYTQGKTEEEDEEEEDEEEGTMLDLTPKERERQLKKLAADEAALAKVEVSHQQLMENVKSLKIQILVLQRKRDDIMGLTEQCKDFLIAAAETEQQEEQQGGMEEDENDLEMSQVGTQTPN